MFERFRSVSVEDAVAFFVFQVTLLGDEGWQWEVSQDGLCSGQFAPRNKPDYSTCSLHTDKSERRGTVLRTAAKWEEKPSYSDEICNLLFCHLNCERFFLLQAVVPAVMKKLRSWREFALRVAIYHTVCVVTGGYVFEQQKNYQYIHTYI